MDPTTHHAASHPGSSGYSKTSWADIGVHFRSGYKLDRSEVIDAVDFTDHPVEVLQRACGKLSLQFSDRMVEGWQGGVINANTGYNLIERHPTELAWTGHATTSTGIVPVTRDALMLDQLPQGMQDHLTQVAIPTYEEMVAFGG